jgi:hypothetical protein
MARSVADGWLADMVDGHRNIARSVGKFEAGGSPPWNPAA